MTGPPRVFGYRPCICDHETHRKRAKKWRYNANQAYHKMVESPLFRLTVKVDIDTLKEDYEYSLDKIDELEEKLLKEKDEIIKLNEEVTKQANNNVYITETIKMQTEVSQTMSKKWAEVVRQRNWALDQAQQAQRAIKTICPEQLECRKLLNNVKNCRISTCDLCAARKRQVDYFANRVEALQKLLFQKKKKLEDLPPTPEIYKPKSPVSSIKVKRKRGSRLQGGGRVSYRESPL